jgi:hypothetical protein
MADPGLVGPFLSLALDESGRPVVSYIDSGKSALRVLHCGNPTCTAANTIARMDSSGEEGFHTSLALDAAGNPVVSYYHLTAGELRVLSCQDPACGAGAASDYDKDTLADGVDADDDNDGCTDAQELQSVEMQGGGRNPLNFWDFFDVATGAEFGRNKAVAASDFFAVLARFGATGDASVDPLSMPAPAPAYHPAYDRGPNKLFMPPLILTHADGSIASTDFFDALTQFGHSCA